MNTQEDRSKLGDLSMTIGDLSMASGLLDITYSDLLSSPEAGNTSKKDGDEDDILCSCFDDGDNNTSKIHDKSCLFEQQAEKIRGGGGGDGVVVVSTSEATTTKESKSDDNNPFHKSHDITSPSVPASTHPVDLSLFNDDDTMHQNSLFHKNNESAFKDSSNISTSNRYSFADSTRFYSLAAGNLKDFEDDDDEDEGTSGEDRNNGHHQSPNSSLGSTGVIEINTAKENVSYKTNGSLDDGKCPQNGFLDSEGDIDVEKFHHKIIEVEKSSSSKDKLLSELIEVLEQTVKDREEKEKENQELMKKVEELEDALKLKEEEVHQRERLSSPTTETYSSQSDPPNSEVEDLKLQVVDLEKKLEADRKYLEDQTIERELERDDFQKTITTLSSKIDDMEKEKERFEILISNQKTELEDYEIRLKEVTDEQHGFLNRIEKLEDEKKSADAKIHELLDTIQSVEKDIEGAVKDVDDFKKQNQILREELDRTELQRKELEQLVQVNQETVPTTNTDITEELQAQVQDLVTRLERKINDMDNFPWSTRSNSSCSGAVSESNEDISVSQQPANVNEDMPLDFATLLSVRKLDAHFESLVRFDEIIMKKLHDTELRLNHSKKRQEELENEKLVLQERINSQIMDISDYKNRLDQFRFDPSPNTVTLSGLRGRVSALTGEVEELKGQLHLKQIEMQDLTDRLAGKEALLDKLSMKIPDVQLPPPVKKYSVSAQTEVAFPPPSPSKNDSVTQTMANSEEQPFKKPKLMNVDASVQTKDFKLSHVDALELSSIQGIPPPTHSTPNEPTVLRTSMRRRQKSATKFSDDFDLERSPEMLREPRTSRLNNSIASHKLPQLPDLKGPDFEKYGSEYGGDGHPVQLYDNLRDPADYLADIPSSVATSFNNQSNPGGGSSNSPANQPLVKTAMADKLQDSGGANNGGKVGSSGAVTVSSGGGKNKRGNSAASQTPPLALANLVDAMDDEEKKRLFEELLKAENLGPVAAEFREIEQARGALQNSSLKMDPNVKSEICNVYKQLVQDPSTFKNLSDSQYSAILNALAFTCAQNTDTLNQVNADDPGIGDSYTFELETTVDFKIDETSDELSLVGTQGRIISSEHGGSRRSSSSSSSSRNQSRNNSIDGPAQSARLPPVSNVVTQDAATSPHELDSVAGGDELNPLNVSNVNWELLQKSQDGRRNEAEARVEAEILKTRIDMLKQALEQERQRHDQPSSDTNSELEKLLSDERGRAEQLEYQVDQQRLEIDELQRRLQAAEEQQSFWSNQVDQQRLEIEELQRRLEAGEEQQRRGSDQEGQQQDEIAELQRRLQEAEDQQNYWRHQMNQQQDEIAELQQHLQEAETEQSRGNNQVDQQRVEISELQRRLQEAEAEQSRGNNQVDQQRVEIAELQRRLHEAEEQQSCASNQVATLSSGCPNINSSPEAIAVQNRRLLHEIQRLEKELDRRMPDIVDPVMLNATHEFARRAAEHVEPERLRNESDELALVELSQDYVNLCAELEKLQALLRGCDRIRVNETTANKRRPSQHWVELYLRAKSYRKALAWQKKYLAIVVQGYKDLMGQSGLPSAFEHPDLFQKQVPMTPSSIGLCDCRNGKTRFRVVGRVVIATIRMKYMVNRWDYKMSSKLVPNLQKRVQFRVDSSQRVFESSSSSNSENDENNVNAKTTKLRTVFSPPTKDAGRTTSKTSLSAAQSLTRDVVSQVNETSSSYLRSHNRNRTGPSQAQRNNFESRHVSGEPSANNNLLQYLERFQNLEKEIGSTIARDSDRVNRVVNKNIDKFV